MGARKNSGKRKCLAEIIPLPFKSQQQTQKVSRVIVYSKSVSSLSNIQTALRSTIHFLERFEPGGCCVGSYAAHPQKYISGMYSMQSMGAVISTELKKFPSS